MPDGTTAGFEPDVVSIWGRLASAIYVVGAVEPCTPDTSDTCNSVFVDSRVVIPALYTQAVENWVTHELTTYGPGCGARGTIARRPITVRNGRGGGLVWTRVFTARTLATATRRKPHGGRSGSPWTSSSQSVHRIPASRQSLSRDNAYFGEKMEPGEFLGGVVVIVAVLAVLVATPWATYKRRWRKAGTWGALLVCLLLYLAFNAMKIADLAEWHQRCDRTSRMIDATARQVSATCAITTSHHQASWRPRGEKAPRLTPGVVNLPTQWTRMALSPLRLWDRRQGAKSVSHVPFPDAPRRRLVDRRRRSDRLDWPAPSAHPPSPRESDLEEIRGQGPILGHGKRRGKWDMRAY